MMAAKSEESVERDYVKEENIKNGFLIVCVCVCVYNQIYLYNFMLIC